MSSVARDDFLGCAAEWLCNGYFLDIRYISLRTGGRENLAGAVIGLNPLPPKQDVSFTLDLGDVRAGQIQCPAPSAMLDTLQSACEGRLIHLNLNLSLPECDKLDYYCDSNNPNNLGADAHLRVLSATNVSFTPDQFRAIDTSLRRADPPFDGLTDLCGWLGLANPASYGGQASIDIRLNPPVDMTDEVALEDDNVVVGLRALASFKPDNLRLAMRVVPGRGLARYQIAHNIEWEPDVDGLRSGKVRFPAVDADIAQLMLTMGTHTIRRRVVVDQKRARTVRLAAVMSLDPGLEALDIALRSTGKDRDANRFEKAVATLLFLHGFAPTPHVDTDGPDLIVASPGGRVAIVECTIRVADFVAKVSKLAARRNKLVSELSLRGHAADVHAVLVCASPRQDIVGIEDRVLANHNVTLITAEGLKRALEKVQRPDDPDEVLARASAALSEVQKQSEALRA